MRTPYLRQLAQPVTAGVSAMRPSRTWPLRADEGRVPVPPSPPASADAPIERRAPPAPRERPVEANEPAPPPTPRSARRLDPPPPVRALASPDVVTAQSRAQTLAPPGPPVRPGPADPHLGPRIASATDQPPAPEDGEQPAARRTVVVEHEPHREAVAAHDPVPPPPHPPPAASHPRAPSAPAPAEVETPPRLLERLRRAAPLRPTASPAVAIDSIRADGPRLPERPRRGPPQTAAGSVAPAGPALKIGTIEVRVTAPPPAAPPPQPPAQRAAAARAPSALSRGFASPFGLRQA